MKAFNLRIRKTICKEITSLVEKNHGAIACYEDSYYGFPTVYADDARCSIPELKGAMLNNRGRVILRVGKEDHRDHLKVLPIPELLQVWDILIKESERLPF